jgi:hypothetical protein
MKSKSSTCLRTIERNATVPLALGTQQGPSLLIWDMVLRFHDHGNIYTSYSSWLQIRGNADHFVAGSFDVSMIDDGKTQI